MAVPSALGDVKIVSPISTFVLNTLTLIKCIFFLFHSCSGNEDKHGLHDIASTKDFLSSPVSQIILETKMQKELDITILAERISRSVKALKQSSSIIWA